MSLDVLGVSQASFVLLLDRGTMSLEVPVCLTSILRIVVRSKGQMSFEVPGYQTSILHIVVRSGDNVIGGSWGLTSIQRIVVRSGDNVIGGILRSNKHHSYYCILRIVVRSEGQMSFDVPVCLTSILHIFRSEGQMSFEVPVCLKSILHIFRSEGQMSFEVVGGPTSILRIIVRSGDNVIAGVWRSNKHSA